MAITFTISVDGAPAVSFASLGLATPRFSFGSMVADTMEVDHLTAAYDAAPLFASRDDVVVYRTADGGSPVSVFRGKRVLAPRFAGPNAESITYTFDGPWGWLEKRDLLQNATVPKEPTEGDPDPDPDYIPQGLVILGQDDTGATVDLKQGLTTVIQAAIDAGVPIAIGSIDASLAIEAGWDWIRDIKIANAIMRLLQVVPDVVVSWDYSVAEPAIHITRRANLTTKTLSIAPANTPAADFGGAGYAEFESIRLVDRPDMVVCGVWLTYRFIDTINGRPSLRIESDIAKDDGAEPTDENAFNRTIELAGTSTTTSFVSQDCVTAIIPVALAGPGNTTPLTPSSDGFEAVKKFLARTEGWLMASGTTITKLTPSGLHSNLSNFRRGLEPNAEGEMVEVAPDTSLTRELVEGYITPWMETGGLNRKGQEQEVHYFVEGTRTIGEEAKPFKATVTRAFMATNVSTRTYTFQESSDTVEGEPVPMGLAGLLYNALSQLQYEGTFVRVQQECSLDLLPGAAINLTGGRTAWASMRAVVQSAAYDLQTGTSTITVGFPRSLGIDDLIGPWRSNRNRQPAQAGLLRATGQL